MKLESSLKKIVLFILLFLLFVGVDYEFEAMSGLAVSSQQFFAVILAASLLLIYVIPFVGLLIFLYKRWQQPLYILPLTFFTGYFSTGWLAGEGNDWLGKKIMTLFGSKSPVMAWLDALTAPVVEEFIKLICVLLLVYLLNADNLKLYFLIGACVGLGFQLCEDVSYIFNIAAEHMNEIVPQAFNRLSGSLTSHWLYTAIFSVGVGSLKSKQLSKKATLVCLSAPILLHFLWNSPLNVSYFVSACLSSISAYLLLKLLPLLDKPDKPATKIDHCV